MPPPFIEGALPLEIVIAEMATLVPGAMWNTRLLVLPFTARLSAPGPDSVIFLSTSSSPLVRAIVPVMAKVTSSPSFAMASASRSDPGPVSFVFVTVMISAKAGIGTVHSNASVLTIILILDKTLGVIEFLSHRFNGDHMSLAPAIRFHAHSAIHGL